MDRPLLLNWLALATVLGAAALGRFRRAFVQLGVILLALWLVGMLAIQLDRPLPYDVETLGRWSGYAAPEVSMAYITAMLVGAAYCFLRPGRARIVALVAVGGLTTLLRRRQGGARGQLPQLGAGRRRARRAGRRRSASPCWCRTRSSRWAAAAPGPRTSTWTSAGRRSSTRWPPSSACGCAS